MSHLDVFLSTSESTRIDIMKEWLREEYQKYFVDSLTHFENQALHVYRNIFLFKIIKYKLMVFKIYCNLKLSAYLDPETFKLMSIEERTNAQNFLLESVQPTPQTNFAQQSKNVPVGGDEENGEKEVPKTSGTTKGQTYDDEDDEVFNSNSESCQSTHSKEKKSSKKDKNSRDKIKKPSKMAQFLMVCRPNENTHSNQSKKANDTRVLTIQDEIDQYLRLMAQSILKIN